MAESGASSHWDAPMVVPDPQIDATDLYAFTSPDRTDTVTVIANYHPFQAANLPYRFATDTRYDINFDSQGDGKPDITYRWVFRNEDNTGLLPAVAIGPVTSVNSGNLRFRQSYTLQKLRPGSAPETLVQDGVAAPSHLGQLVMPDYDRLRREVTRKLPGGGQTYAGQAADPFYANLKATSLIRFGAAVPPIKTGVPLNVNTMVLQVPKAEVALRGDAARNPVVGIWATAARRIPALSGQQPDTYAQVSRAGNGTFNEVFLTCALNLPCAANDRFNALSPVNDGATPELLQGVLRPAKPRQIQVFTGVPAPAEPRNDLREALLTGIADRPGAVVKDDLNSQALNQDSDASRIIPAEELRLNMSTPVSARPDRLGYLAGDRQGFPNGRRLDDDVTVAVLALLEGALTTPGMPGVGEDVKGGEPLKKAGKDFPYLATPIHL